MDDIENLELSYADAFMFNVLLQHAEEETGDNEPSDAPSEVILLLLEYVLFVIFAYCHFCINVPL